MSVLVDTSFFVALKSLKDVNHDRAVGLFRGILQGELGVLHATDLVFAEAVTTALARLHRHSAAVGVGGSFSGRSRAFRCSASTIRRRKR